MKYVVRVNGEDHEVELDGETVVENGASVAAQAIALEGTPIRVVTIGDAVHRVVVRRGAGRGQYTLWLGGHRFDVEALDERARAIRALAGAVSAATGPAPLVAPMPGLIVRVNVQAGDSVQAGQGLVVMEAMKMENELRAQSAGVVARVHVAPGTAVEKGALLLDLE